MARLILVLLYIIFPVLIIKFNILKRLNLIKEYANQKVFIPEWNGGNIMKCIGFFFIILSLIIDNDGIPVLYLGLLLYLILLFDVMFVFTEEKLLMYQLPFSKKSEFSYKELIWKEESQFIRFDRELKVITLYKDGKKIISINPNAFVSPDQMYQFIMCKIPMQK